MSITTTSTKDSYTGNNSTSTPYPITFKYLEDSHITVYVDGVALSDSYYTLTGDGSLGTGQFTTDVAYADTKKVVVVLDVPFNQPVELLETGALSSSTLEEAYDRLNMQIRRVWRKAQDVLTFSTDEANGSTGTADNLLGFNGTGNLAEIPNTTFEPAKGTDDNFVTDAEKVVISNTSGSNTGDQVIPLSTVDFDPVGTDNSTPVTKAGTGTYVSLAGQVLTVDPIDEADLNASINLSLDKADTALQSGGVVAADVSDFETAVTANTSVAANTSASHAAVTKSGTPDYVSLTGQDIVVAQVDLATDVTGNLPLANLNSGTNASASTFWRGDGTWFAPSGSGDMVASIYDPDNNALPIGTVKGTGATTLNIAASDEGAFASTTARGESSVDLQIERNAVDQVAEGANSALVAGKNNKAVGIGSAVVGGINNTATGNYSFVTGSTNTCTSGRGFIGGGINNDITSTGVNNAVVGGSNNDITGTLANGAILGGQENVVSGINAVTLGGLRNTASGADSLAAGEETTASDTGSRVFGDSTSTAFASIASEEFAIQGSALRLVDGNEGAGKVLTSDANGSGNWAAPAKVVYTVATLPATPAQGDVAIVTDATATTFHSIVAGTGSNIVPVFYDGINWRIG